MAFIPVPDTVKFTLEFVLAGQTVIITIHFKKTGGWTLGQIDTVGHALIGWFTDEVAPSLSSQISLNNIGYTDLSSSTAPSGLIPVIPAVAGGNGGESVPNNVAFVITERTDLRGRSYRGRSYLPGIPADTLPDPGHVSTGDAAAYAGIWSTLADFADDNDIEHVVVSRQIDGAPRVTGVATLITSYTTDTNLDSQRRRLPGRGA